MEMGHLATGSTSTKLPAFNKAPIKVHSDWPLIHFSAAQILHRILCILASVVHNKAEATGCFLLLVQAHDDTLHISTSGEDLSEAGSVGMLYNISSHEFQHE